MFKKVLFSLLACAQLCAGISLPANPLKSTPTQKVVIDVTHGMTAADLFAKEINGEKKFKLPDAPHFSYYFMGNMPQEYSSMFDDKLTLAAFIRFIETGHELFENQTTANAYKSIVKSAIAAHKSFKRSPTDKNKQTLIEMEQKVFNLLSEITLQNPAITQKLAKILSTPRTALDSLKKIVASILLPFRTYIEKNREGKNIIQLNSWRESVLFLMIKLVLLKEHGGDYTKVKNPAGKDQMIDLGGFIVFAILVAGLTELNLAPEPYPISVEFNHQLSEETLQKPSAE